MTLQIEKIDDHETWIAARKSRGIGGSDAAAIVGQSNWQSNIELWEILTGRKETKNLSNNTYVQKGHDIEPVLREMFRVLHPEYEVSYRPYDLYYQIEYPWMFATLDGVLVEKETGRSGVLEIKSGNPSNRESWSKWDNQIPMAYYCQVLHQLNATGFDFVILFAGLFKLNGEMLIKAPYVIEREDVLDDMEWLLEQEKEFWQCVQERKMPPMKLTI